MGKKENQLYEGAYVFSVTLSEEARRKALDKVISGITNYGGEIHKIHDQGRKKLAYTIRGAREGYYYFIYFSVSPGAITELWKEYHLNEDLLRFMTLRADSVKEVLEFASLPE
ncbi:30S ribosomal protein S6 [Chlamydia pneumoniae TW-183]|uniref:Small ribosomal subunit protein bS6 n=2 Tax=Chlamydia pneumoniae TaxID=83558 RepID=RS6_CHLPN|nr:30S ribosomal protein S6 [Chlamydia pneumoniae]Q9Z6V5.1 RecName: Full=Small ribosomal subunit protein bS6; AltName: Full=30S ribosomal protein S6 [Chlamydia pneumoniae]AAD19089.1 S6 Ribosomal Protein [Chlamydia pneumoniae CWL029]AAF38693.1 ribosomal protein S6 [Chlamydia pneumoniae AR39]AAP98917.1 30S ribosomal protein S6 [Chlamydia pneumoniae TW-183]ACZ32843.1 ribosomal protein S6 [Chlamydia pneumoniae LPCoLN]ETR79714.1 SSU ribosomal protein S6p [Chlamydia pneumoniae B21]